MDNSFTGGGSITAGFSIAGGGSVAVGASAGVGVVVAGAGRFAAGGESGLVVGSEVAGDMESGWVKLIFCQISSRQPCGIRYQTNGPPARSVTRKTTVMILQRRNDAWASRYRSPIKEPRTWVSSFDS